MVSSRIESRCTELSWATATRNGVPSGFSGGWQRVVAGFRGLVLLILVSGCPFVLDFVFFFGRPDPTLPGAGVLCVSKPAATGRPPGRTAPKTPSANEIFYLKISQNKQKKTQKKHHFSFFLKRKKTNQNTGSKGRGVNSSSLWKNQWKLDEIP